MQNPISFDDTIATYPAAAAPANGVSGAEVLRAVYDRQFCDGTNASTNSKLGKKVTRTAADIFNGTHYSCPFNEATALLGGSGGGCRLPQARGWLSAEGTIDLLTVADVGTGGALGYCELWYIPLDDGATVTST